MQSQLTRLILVSFVLSVPALLAIAQATPAESVQITPPPPLRRIEPPAPDATADQLEDQADLLRAEKAFPDSLEYFRAALAKKPNNAQILNKMGIVELQTQHFKEAKKNFERVIRIDDSYADAYNNLGVVYYELKKYNKAITYYRKALEKRNDSASFYNTFAGAYFSKKEFEKSVAAYAEALRLDPDIFERTSRTGVSAQLPSPADRAKYDYVVARLYAKMGLAERSLQYLRRAIEEGYKDIALVYKDSEFSSLRKDPRFAELMAAKLPGIPSSQD